MLLPRLPKFLRPRPKVSIGSYGPFGWWPHRIPIHHLSTHMYIVGRSGSGKSKFIEGFLWQLITKGQGCAFIDPHADSANHLLKLLAFQPFQKGKSWLDTEGNVNKLIFCEPGRKDYITPWNLFKSQGNPYTIATNIWEAFRRTWSSSLSAAPQSKNIAIHSLLLLIENRMSLVDLPRIFFDEHLRNRLVAQSRNPEVIKFFQNRFANWGKQGLQRAEPLLNKVTALTLNDNLRWMLGSSDNKLNLRRIMDKGQVLIVNLGWCDHETRALMGSLLTVSLEQAAMSRVKIPEQFRRPFFCVIDEFQGFVDTDGSSHILSETRKAKVRFAFAHQGQYQLPTNRFQSIQEQTPFKMLFGCGIKTAEAVAKEVFTPKTGGKQSGNASAQREAFVQRVKNLRPREIVAWRLGEKLRYLKTLKVATPQVSGKQLDTIKVKLLLRLATPTIKDEKPNRSTDIPPPYMSSDTSFLG